MRMFVILIVMVTLYGCAATQPNIKIKLQTSFDLERTRRAMVDGSNTIEGSALMRQVNGGVVTCAGQEVVATPVTTCSTERIRYLYGNDTAEFRDMNNAISNPNPFEETPNEYVTNQRRTVCDAQGFFSSKNWRTVTFLLLAKFNGNLTLEVCSLKADS